MRHSSIDRRRDLRYNRYIVTTDTKPQAIRSHFNRVRGYLASLAVVGFAATAVIGPLSQPGPALADQEFYERINQQFVPSGTEPIDVILAASTAEELPPEPAAVPATESASSSGEAAAIPTYTGGGSPAEWMAAAGIPESDWGYVDAIVSRESGWNPNATNASSGACGLVQALPCSKVPGNGYNPVDNLNWAIGYANGRYGGWAGAYNFWQANHWW